MITEATFQEAQSATPVEVTEWTIEGEITHLHGPTATHRIFYAVVGDASIELGLAPVAATGHEFKVGDRIRLVTRTRGKNGVFVGKHLIELL